MKKRVAINIIVLVFITMLLVSSSSYAIYTGSAEVTGNVVSAEWNVSLNQANVENYLSVIPNGRTDTYTLNIVSNSGVDVIYSIVISNLPTGISVKLDDNENFTEQSNNSIIFSDAGTILYSGLESTKTHTLTFKAASGTQVVNEEQINIDVIVRQFI